MTNQHDRMVGEYLDAVRRATVDLAPDRRDDLLADLSEHIATARSDLDPETEAGVHDILERLGDPVSIAAEARLGTTPPPAVPTGPIALATPVKPLHSRRNITLIVAGVVAAVLLLCCLAPAVALIAFSSTRVEHSTPTAPQPQPSPLPSATTTG
jgi:HAAS